MSDTMLEDEVEPQEREGRVELLAACLCFGLSLLCVLLWISLLVAPSLMHVLF